MVLQLKLQRRQFFRGFLHRLSLGVLPIVEWGVGKLFKSDIEPLELRKWLVGFFFVANDLQLGVRPADHAYLLLEGFGFSVVVDPVHEIVFTDVELEFFGLVRSFVYSDDDLRLAFLLAYAFTLHIHDVMNMSLVIGFLNLKEYVLEHLVEKEAITKLLTQQLTPVFLLFVVVPVIRLVPFLLVPRLKYQKYESLVWLKVPVVYIAESSLFVVDNEVFQD